MPDKAAPSRIQPYSKSQAHRNKYMQINIFCNNYREHPMPVSFRVVGIVPENIRFPFLMEGTSWTHTALSPRG